MVRATIAVAAASPQWATGQAGSQAPCRAGPGCIRLIWLRVTSDTGGYRACLNCEKPTDRASSAATGSCSQELLGPHSALGSVEDRVRCAPPVPSKRRSGCGSTTKGLTSRPRADAAVPIVDSTRSLKAWDTERKRTSRRWSPPAAMRAQAAISARPGPEKPGAREIRQLKTGGRAAAPSHRQHLILPGAANEVDHLGSSVVRPKNAQYLRPAKPYIKPIGQVGH